MPLSNKEDETGTLIANDENKHATKPRKIRCNQNLLRTLVVFVSVGLFYIYLGGFGSNPNIPNQKIHQSIHTQNKAAATDVSTSGLIDNMKVQNNVLKVANEDDVDAAAPTDKTKKKN